MRLPTLGRRTEMPIRKRLKAAYDHSQDSSQAHSDYLVNNANDTTTGTITMAGAAISADEATITHSGTTSLTIASTSGSVIVEGYTFAAGAMSVAADSATITHGGATSLTISSTSGTVIVEGVTFTGAAISGATNTNWDAAYASRIQEAERAVAYTDLTDSDGSQSFDFGAALPSDAVILCAYIDVTTGFTDGSSGVFTVDLGISGGDLDALIDGADLANIANVSSPVGIGHVGSYSGTTLAVTVLADVNVDTATAGALTARVLYVDRSEIV